MQFKKYLSNIFNITHRKSVDLQWKRSMVCKRVLRISYTTHRRQRRPPLFWSPQRSTFDTCHGSHPGKVLLSYENWNFFRSFLSINLKNLNFTEHYVNDDDNGFLETNEWSMFVNRNMYNDDEWWLMILGRSDCGRSASSWWSANASWFTSWTTPARLCRPGRGCLRPSQLSTAATVVSPICRIFFPPTPPLCISRVTRYWYIFDTFLADVYIIFWVKLKSEHFMTILRFSSILIINNSLKEKNIVIENPYVFKLLKLIKLHRISH